MHPLQHRGEGGKNFRKNFNVGGGGGAGVGGT